MANYLATDTDLTAVANAIRQKGGTSAQLEFPDEFVSAVQAIPTGGGGFSADDIANGDVDGDIVLTASVIPAYRFAGQKIRRISSDKAITYSSVPNAGGGNLIGRQFLNCAMLQSVSFPNSTVSADSEFWHCTSLTDVNLKKQTTVGTQQFDGCTALQRVVFPNLAGADGVYTNAFADCSSLSVADLGGTGVAFKRTNAFKNSALSTLIIRSATVAALTNINNFDGTPFASGGSGGTLYVPQALIASYQAATNWSTILGYANNSIQAIEGSVYENAYADGTPVT